MSKDIIPYIGYTFLARVSNIHQQKICLKTYSFATIKERTKPVAMITLSVLRISIRIENSNLEPNISISYHTLRLIEIRYRIYFLIHERILKRRRGVSVIYLLRNIHDILSLYRSISVHG